MDLIEMMTKLQVEEAMKTIEVAARVVEEAGLRLKQRTEFWRDWNGEVELAAEAALEAKDKYAHATTEDDRDDSEDKMFESIDKMRALSEEGAFRLEKDAQEDEDARRAAAGHGTLEGHLRHPHEVP
jgi:hypothetical protein